MTKILKKLGLCLALLGLLLPLGAQEREISDKHIEEALVGELVCLALPPKTPEARADYECIYEYALKSKAGELLYPTILQTAGERALFRDYTAYQLDSIRQQKNVPDSVVEAYRVNIFKSENFFEEEDYEDLSQGTLRVYSPIPPMYYSYEEPLGEIQWETSEEGKELNGYQCYKATGRYGGRLWTVWYAPSIPLPYGPWKLGGLPGLILQAEDSEGIHRFSAIGFRASSVELLTPSYPDAQQTSREKFLKAKVAFEANPMGSIPQEAIREMQIIKRESGASTILINGVQLRRKVDGYIPLEVE